MLEFRNFKKELWLIMASSKKLECQLEGFPGTTIHLLETHEAVQKLF